MVDAREPVKRGRDKGISGLEDTMAAASGEGDAESASGPGPESPADDPPPSPLAGTLTATRPADTGDRRTDPPGLDTVARERYAVEREIARGGMGRILRARDRRHGRVVAIKESLRPEPDLIARFTREALITARLQHPAIVPVYEAGRWDNGDPFYAMKLVDGRSLSEELEERRTLVSRLALLPNLLAVTEALAYAHTSGIIHRDLKPSNIIVGRFGETVVIDWGLAKDLSGDVEDDPWPTRALADSPALTAAGHVIGTPAYMAPEQAEGAMVDHRADVYALGAIIYHLLSGCPPYVGKSSAEVLDAVVDGPPMPVRKRIAGVPMDLAAIVDRAMARNVDERYPTAKELAEDLRRFQTGQLVRTHEYSMVELVRRFLARHRGAVAVAAVMILAMVGLGAVAVDRIVEERNIARTERARAEKLREIAMSRRSAAEDVVASLLDKIDRQADGLGKADLLADVSAGVMAYYDGADAVGELDSERRTGIMRLLAKAHQRQGHFDLAVLAYRKAIAEANRMAEMRPEARDVPLLIADSHNRIGEMLNTRGQAKNAEGELRQAIAIVEALPVDDPEHRAQLRDSYSQLGLSLLMKRDRQGSNVAFRISEEHARERRPTPSTPPKPDAPAAKVIPLVQPAAHGVVEMRAHVSSAEHGGELEALQVVSEQAPALGLLHSLERLDQQLEAVDHAGHALVVWQEVASALSDEDSGLDAAAEELALAKAHLEIARLAPEQQHDVAAYAQRCARGLASESAAEKLPTALRERLQRICDELGRVANADQEPTTAAAEPND